MVPKVSCQAVKRLFVESYGIVVLKMGEGLASLAPLFALGGLGDLGEAGGGEVELLARVRLVLGEDAASFVGEVVDEPLVGGAGRFRQVGRMLGLT
jgi:hypothetical protein